MCVRVFTRSVNSKKIMKIPRVRIREPNAETTKLKKLQDSVLCEILCLVCNYVRVRVTLGSKFLFRFFVKKIRARMLRQRQRSW